MKKIFSIIALCGLSFSYAQISLAAKANLLIPTSSASWDNISNAIAQKGSNAAGFNVGLSLKISTPTKFFVQPELYYTNFKSSADVTVSGVTTNVEAKSSRLDLPVLVGMNVVGNLLGIYAGPVASVHLNKNETFGQFAEDIKNNFSMGYQLGAQAEISKLIFTARYEGAFSSDQRKFINSVTGSEVNYDSRPSFFIVGLGYKF